jgi:hypothetical protein
VNEKEGHPGWARPNQVSSLKENLEIRVFFALDLREASCCEFYSCEEIILPMTTCPKKRTLSLR